jgi:hypothetical protein
MTESSLSFTWTWAARDHARVSNLLLREKFGTWYWRLAGWLTILLIVASMVIAVLFTRDRPAALLSLTPWLILIALWLSFARWGSGWLQAWGAKRLDPNIAHPFEHILAEDALHIHAHTANTELKWSGVYKVTELPDLFLFYYNKRCAYYLPKRAFTSPDQVHAVRAFLRAHVPGNLLLLEAAA